VTYVGLEEGRHRETVVRSFTQRQRDSGWRGIMVVYYNVGWHTLVV